MDLMFYNIIRSNILIFDVVEFTKYQNKDCLYYKNIHSLNSTQQQNYEDCKTWCRVNSHCGGFTAYHGVCYFKSKNCKNNLFGHGERTTFLLKGKIKDIKITNIE